MEYKGKKFCFVPFCGARRELNRETIFFQVPKDRFLREQWSKAARRNPGITGPNTAFYCCQDHFNLEEDLENYDKFVEDKEKVRPHLKANVIPHIFTCLEDIPPASDLRKRRMLLPDNEEEDIIPLDNGKNDTEEEEEEVTRLTLDQMNQLLIDINNLGILGDVLNAYNQVYDEMKWIMEFVVEHLGSMFSICIKKVGEETSNSKSDHADTPMNKAKRKRQLPNFNVDDFNVEIAEEPHDGVDEALIDGGHIYSSVQTTKNISDNPKLGKQITGEPEIFPVYQCEYCCYGSREKYCLEHHIMSKHSKRFMVFNQEKQKAKDKLENDKKINPSKNGKRVKLPYYMPRDKSLSELTKLSKEVQRRSEWLDDFITSLLNEQKNSIKIKSGQSYSCAFCNFTGPNQIEVYKHIGLEHTTENGIFNMCPICQLKTSDRKSLFSHLRETHPGTNLFNCKRCQYNTDSLQNYFRHIVEVHKRQREFKCNDCHFVTTRKSNLLKHLDSMHRKDLFGCKENGCEYKAPSEKALNSHIMTVHAGIHPFVCTVPTCHFAASKQYLLDRHLLQMHGPVQTPPASSAVSNVKPGKINCLFGCMQCGKKFNKKQKLEKHERIFHLGIKEQFKCGYCSFVSNTKMPMDIHIAEVHENYFPFKCDKCDFKTSVKLRFQTHYNTEHLKQKPFPCPYCHIRFEAKAQIEEHIQDLHLKEKPHLCTYCNFTTAHKCNLRSHLKTIHKISESHINQALKSCVDMRKKYDQENIKEGGMLLIGIEELGKLMENGNVLEHHTILQPEHSLPGVVTLKDGDVILPGTILQQDGNVVLHDVHTVLQDGSVVLQNRNSILEESNTVLLEGNNSVLTDENNPVLNDENAVHNDVSLQCNDLQFGDNALHEVQDKLGEEETFEEDETLGQLLEEDSSLEDDGVLYDDEESLQGDEVLLNDETLHSEVILHDSSNILQEMDLVIENQD